MWSRLLFSVLLALKFFSSVASSGAPPGSDIQAPSGYTLLKVGPKGSKLFSIDAKSSVYQDAPLLLDLTKGSSYDQGFDNAFLLGKAYLENYNSLMVALLGNDWWEPAVADLLSLFLQWQWEGYLKVQVPEEYLEELRGMSAGGKAAGIFKPDIGQVAGWGITLANFPGSLENLKYILLDEKNNAEFLAKLQAAGLSMKQLEEVLKKLNWSGLTCSMFGVWGSRTQGTRLFTGRNLDWEKDTGMSKYKLITVHHPPTGHAHATFGFAGIWGALAGMSNQGLTVHEANLESNDITFRGFPWVLRLRHVMAHASNLAEALQIWAMTNSTVGFNHGIGSASDGEAICLETMKGNNAVFHANDIREQDLVVNKQQIGMPREEAIYRTNHGYDAYTLEHYLWNDTTWYQSSITRYLLFPEMLDAYQLANKSIGATEAVNMTAIVGSKGLNTLYDCVVPNDGTNVLSVTFDPKELVAYTAWENGHGADRWIPAACSTYLKIDLKRWF